MDGLVYLAYVREVLSEQIDEVGKKWTASEGTSTEDETRGRYYALLEAHRLVYDTLEEAKRKLARA